MVMATAMSGPRVLLRQLRETMAEPLASQDRLDKIVNLIATNMHTDVCSFYVLRGDNALELFATYGLKRESVHMRMLPTIPPSPTGRRRAKILSVHSSACRCSAPARRSACSSSRTRTIASMARTRPKRC